MWVRVSSAALLMLATLPCVTGWSFATFLEGEWDLERQRGSELAHAHYSLSAVGSMLEGTYHEEGGTPEERTNEMRVRVEFDRAAPDTAGRFQLAKRKGFDAQTDGEDPTPRPAGEEEYGPFRTLFEFDFQPRSGEHFWISESRWLSGQGGTVQFIAVGGDAFVFSQVSDATAGVNTWTASRHGVAVAEGSLVTPRASMLQRWWKWLGALAMYLAYRMAQDLKQKQKKS